ncbi:hypothetical protein Pat9b_2145 [Pantoea sp. At-9b]|nr:hypothetical protein Pat9b_2145 [Pantoea sp. At-9b]
MKGMLKPINDTATGGALLCALSVMTGRTGASSSCGPIIRICVSYRSGISRSISGSLKGMAEQRELLSRGLLQILP